MDGWSSRFSEEALIMRNSGSDRDLPWAEVIDELHTFVARRVANPAAASEITSAVIERVHRRTDQLQDDDRFTAWVLAVARNAVIDHYRSTARRQDRPASEIADLGEVELIDTDHSADIREELAACVAPLLADLPTHTARPSR
jgi:RNA polymerase sigma-70 factor, ECF subfamily